jgi:hypothetical protein
LLRRLFGVIALKSLRDHGPGCRTYPANRASAYPAAEGGTPNLTPQVRARGNAAQPKLILVVAGGEEEGIPRFGQQADRFIPIRPLKSQYMLAACTPAAVNSSGCRVCLAPRNARVKQAERHWGQGCQPTHGAQEHHAPLRWPHWVIGWLGRWATGWLERRKGARYCGDMAAPAGLVRFILRSWPG